MLRTLTTASPAALADLATEKKIRCTESVFLLFSLGSQFDHLIAQQLAKLGVYCLPADPAQVTAADVKKVNPAGIILSGGPVSVHQNPPAFDQDIFDTGIPVLGICLGFQMLAQYIGDTVCHGDQAQYGVHTLTVIQENNLLFHNVAVDSPVLLSHQDLITSDRPCMSILARTANAPVAAAQGQGRHCHLYGLQFHPEVNDTQYGPIIFDNFIGRICRVHDRFPAQDTSKQKVKEVAAAINNKTVLLALSGGSDSSVVAYLLRNALSYCSAWTAVHAVYIEGLDRPDDQLHVQKFFAGLSWLNLKFVDATGRFLHALQGATNMAAKRIAMRGVYQKVINEQIASCGADLIIQGTLYTDICESGGGMATGADKARIKLHHNVALQFDVPEECPLQDQVKDTARALGYALKVPNELLTRHPFPGPGLIVRVEGAITPENLAVARQADSIFLAGLREWKLYDFVWQAGAVVTQSVHTGTKGDDAAEGAVVALWAVTSVNGFTARAAKLPWEFIQKISQQITNAIPTVGAVVYRTSDKPPATIEWG